MSDRRTPEENQIAAIQIAADLRSNPELKERVLKDPYKGLTELYDISPDLAKEIIKEDPNLWKSAGDISLEWCICTGCCVTTITFVDVDERINPAITNDRLQAQILENLIKSGYIKEPRFRR